MRGNWTTGDPVAAASVKGEQQITVEHRSSDIPLRSPATPAWNIADRIVKEELPEDKNNDSGVSPGHYTSNSVSPRSRRSSSVANGSLSPGSASSQDSSAMQYEYSPQRIFESCVSPLGFHPARNNNGGERSPKLLLQSSDYPNDMASRQIIQANRNSLQNEQPVDMVSSTMKQDSDDSDNAVMQCPICPYNTSHRMQFNEHLAAHCSPKQCDTTDYSTSSYTQLSSLSEDGGARGSPSQGEDRSEHEFDDVDEPGLRVPRVNCQGKVKTFKCKQCNFTAVTKLAFWEHSRGHIKAEKLLTCPRCPFVTEYKHHLEYHLRNHFNSKPFKCDKCPYSCVNKSMLNSHLKSHSNVYQYRCAECSYATKYCHSLKLHLRKYAHKPAMVLNPDGSPNPLPIIDIYGTRRGPKQKSTASKTVDDGVSQSPHIIGSTGMTPVSVMQNIASVQSTGSLFANEHLIQPPLLHGAQTLGNIAFPYSQIFNAVGSLPGGHFFQQFHENNNHCNGVENRKQQQQQLFDNVFGLYNNRDVQFGGDDFYNMQKDAGGKRLSPIASSLGDANAKLKEEYESAGSNATSCLESGNRMNPESEDPTAMKIASEMIASPLDLSKPETTRDINNSKTNSPRTGGTSRRKGRAFKLDKLVVLHDSEDESTSGGIPQHADGDDNVKQQRQYHCDHQNDNDDCNDVIRVNNNKDDVLISADAGVVGGNNSDYNCQYCDIAFGNVVMYTMHMGYHGYKNPYTCNMCGHQCDDKVSFFLHIARDSHS